MASENLRSRRGPVDLSEAHGSEGSYVDWAAIAWLLGAPLLVIIIVAFLL